MAKKKAPLTVEAIDNAVRLLEDAKWYLQAGEGGEGKAVHWAATAHKVIGENLGMPVTAEDEAAE
jgi:hypothetical protein